VLIGIGSSGPGFNTGSFPPYNTRLSILSSHRVYRVPDFLAGRLNWLPHPPSPHASVSPLDSIGGGTITCLRRRELRSQLRRRDRHYCPPRIQMRGGEAHILAWGEGVWGANWDEGIGSVGIMVFYLLIPSLCFVLSTALECTLLRHIQY
jgi:hypothetical protein